MDAARLVRRLRLGAGMTLRELAGLAATSHSTLAAYEAGRVVPSVDTLDRIGRAAGTDLRVTLVPRVGGIERGDRGRELAEVLELAAMFPARHSATLECPPFPSARQPFPGARPSFPAARPSFPAARQAFPGAPRPFPGAQQPVGRA